MQQVKDPHLIGGVNLGQLKAKHVHLPQIEIRGHPAREAGHFVCHLHLPGHT